MLLRSFTDVLALWTPAQFSRVMGLRYLTARGIYARRVVSPAHWSRLIEATKLRGEILTADMLIRFRDEAAAKSRERRQEQAIKRPRGRPRSKSQSQSLPVP